MSGLKWSNFFRDVNGNESMTTLMLFLSFWPSTYVMVSEANENIFYAYMAAFAGLAANKQWASRGSNNLDSTQSTQISLDADSGAVDVVSSKKNLGSVQSVRGSTKKSR